MPGPQEGSTIQQQIGSVFKIFRLAEGMTQYQAAEHCGTTQARINYLERGKGDIKIDTLVKLAKAWGYDVEIAFTVPDEEANHILGED